jgi:hypothetical protein
MTRPSTTIFVIAILSSTILLAPFHAEVIIGTEVTRIAASIAGGRGFSSPFSQPTGPSAWIPPVYPYLLAGIFYVFGAFTAASYWVAVMLNIIVHALTCIVLYWAAGEAFGRRAGLYAAIALASFPLLFYPLVLLHVLGGYGGQGLFIPPNMIWYTHLSELTIVLLIWLTMRPFHWAVYGAAWGITALINPTALSMAPAFLAWRLRHHRESWRHLGLSLATAVLCVTPWLVRNFEVFHRPVFIRDNFGVELRVGNQPGSGGQWIPSVHPDQNAYELSRMAAMGEVEYAHDCGQEAVNSIRSRPGEFVRDTIRRIAYWWIGHPLTSQRLHALRFLKYLPQLTFSLLTLYGTFRVLRRGNQEAQLFVAVLVFYPLIYYVTHTFTSYLYVYPIQPEMLALATAGLRCE